MRKGKSTALNHILLTFTCDFLLHAQSRNELERARVDAALAPAVVDTWPYRARNTLFYAPDAMGAEESNDGTAQVCVRGQWPPSMWQNA
jgi:hypothetical protein